MSSQNTCGTCRHWNVGLCCRFPPVHAGRQLTAVGLSPAWVFPEVKADDSCGEWQSKEPSTEDRIERRAE